MLRQNVTEKKYHTDALIPYLGVYKTVTVDEKQFDLYKSITVVTVIVYKKGSK